MARTRSIKKEAGQPITAAALPLYPKSPLADEYSRQVADYLVNQQDGLDSVCWNYYRTIPELHYLVSLMGNALGQVTFNVKLAPDATSNEPTDLGPRHPALDLMGDFAGGPDGLSELVNKLAVHLTVIGDSILVGPQEGATNLPYPYDQARVYSLSEVMSRNGKIFVRGPNYREESLPDGAFAVRIWKQNPQLWWHADSPVKSSLSTLREIELLNKHVQADAISRLKGSGILFVPEEFTLPGAEVETEGIDADPFTSALSEIMSIAIKDPNSAAALVPIILRGPAEFGKDIRLIDFHTQFDAMIPDLRDSAIRKLALGMDAPPEILLGSEASASWSMWQISEAQLRLHIKPMAHLIAASLTEGWLKPALRALPLPQQTKDTIDDLIIWPDFTRLFIRPDIGKDAETLFKDNIISEEAYRHILGFGPPEAPSKKELAYQILIKLVNSPMLGPYAIKALSDNHDIPLPAVTELATKAGIIQGGEGDKTTPGDTAPPAAPAAPAKPGIGVGTAPQIPGKRSVDKQTALPKAPPSDGDPGNNQANSPSKK